MKASELRKLIREEVRKVVKEEDDNYGEGFGYMKPFTKDITAVISNLKAINNKIEIEGPLSEDIIDALESLEGLLVKINQAQ